MSDLRVQSPASDRVPIAATDTPARSDHAPIADTPLTVSTNMMTRDSMTHDDHPSQWLPGCRVKCQDDSDAAPSASVSDSENG